MVCDVPQGWGTQLPIVFAVELRGALVADLECGVGGLHRLDQHQPQRFVQPQLFLILEWAHGRQ